MATLVNQVTDFLGFTNSSKNEGELPTKPGFTPEYEGERKILFEWSAPQRTQVSKFDTKGNRNLMVIGAVVALLLILMQEFLLIAVIASVIFLKQVLSATPAGEARHQLTNHGVSYNGEFFGWETLERFFFVNADGHETLCIDTKERLPGRLFMIINSNDRDVIKEIVGRYILYLEQEPKNFADKIYDSAVGKINLG